jgi:tetratricopeptide (TPR) repeat protein
MPQMTVEEMCQSAVAHHRAGRLAAAEKIYHQILVQDPNHLGALFLMGIASAQAGEFNAAIGLFTRVVQLRPDNAEGHCALASALVEKDELDKAILSYRRAIEFKRNYTEAYQGIGIALGKQGRFDEAISAFNAAIQLNPNVAAVQFQLGDAYFAKAQFENAAQAFRRATELDPQYAEAHAKLGAVLAESNQFEAALISHKRALAIRPESAIAHELLGHTLLLKKETSSAVESLRRAVTLAPQVFTAWNTLGLALKSLGRFEEASTSFVHSLTVRPEAGDAFKNIADLAGQPVAYLRLGEALANKGRFDEAAMAFMRASELKPDYFEAHNHLSIVQAELKRLDEALISHGHAAALRPGDPLVHQALGIILTQKGDLLRAVENFRLALAQSPDLVPSLKSLGSVLNMLGQFEEAAVCFRRALAIQPNAALFYLELAGTARNAADNAEFVRLTALLDRPRLPTEERIAVGFALGKLLDDADRYEEAFAHYAQGNALVKKQQAAGGEHFDAGEFHRYIDQAIECFTPQFFANRQGWGEASDVPVFIVGTPRSGTTLVEQIAASHPDVFGAGERKDIYPIAMALGGGNGVAAHRWNIESVKTAAKTQLDVLRALGGAASRVIDKMPDNVLQLGLISLLFPSARVIFCRRGPQDNCLSCYFQWFKNGNLWSYDLADCGRRFLEIDRLANHWLRVLPLKMLEVQYEDMVADLEGQSRRLIDFLGLSWNAACLDFHKTQRTVVTASTWQVRQPIYTRSVGRWRNYEKHLGPLLEVLGNGSQSP